MEVKVEIGIGEGLTEESAANRLVDARGDVSSISGRNPHFNTEREVTDL